MGLLVLDRRDMALRLDGEAAAVYEGGRRAGSVPLKLVDQLVVQGSGIVVEASVLGRVAEQGGMGVVLSGRYGRRVAWVLGPSHHDVTARLAQARAVTDPPQVDAWALRVVLGKLRHQHRFLCRALALRPDAHKPLHDALRRLEAALAQLDAKQATVCNPGAAALRGIEGAAAAAYFDGYGSLFPPALGFNGRNRRPPRDPVNACLSLAYTLLHAQAVQACQCAGLDPLLGLYHRPAHGRASLASDLIEPMRPLVDEWVWRLVRDGLVRPEDFRHEGDACLLGKSGRERFYPAYGQVRRKAARWLRWTCADLVRQWRRQGCALLPEDGVPGIEDD
ncbi:CRISPR-associated endonuclease Cas1 [uncultured Azohydromonas sp.]|jgi:CRISPR-associated endonuclease Cas1|uniref:CRISPR-associated endonuclease Cas1 n=1 Tax=uncultured Azohydromonas sp. TaxID=487342 RepID=UPI00260E910D|nr:CRISPR-associated endonuclease Cas1 [uncultured Azohydromonas sp.]